MAAPQVGQLNRSAELDSPVDMIPSSFTIYDAGAPADGFTAGSRLVAGGRIALARRRERGY